MGIFAQCSTGKIDNTYMYIYIYVCVCVCVYVYSDYYIIRRWRCTRFYRDGLWARLFTFHSQLHQAKLPSKRQEMIGDSWYLIGQVCPYFITADNAFGLLFRHQFWMFRGNGHHTRPRKFAILVCSFCMYTMINLVTLLIKFRYILLIMVQSFEKVGDITLD